MASQSPSTGGEVYESLGRGGAGSPARGTRAATGMTVAEERIARQADQPGAVSGVFEGTAGTDTRFVAAPEAQVRVPESTADIQTAYEYFSGKAFKAVDYERGFPPYRQRGIDATDEIAALRESLVGEYTRNDLRKLAEQIAKEKGKSELESPLEKISRLRSEVTEMMNYVDSFIDAHGLAKKGGEGAGDATTVEKLGVEEMQQARRYFGVNDPRVLFQELQGLKHQLDQVSSSPIYNQIGTFLSRSAVETAEANIAPAPLSIEARQAILAQLRTLEAKLCSVEQQQGEQGEQQQGEQQVSDVPGQPLIYELFNAAEPREHVTSTRLFEVEQRLAALEDTLGIRSPKAMSLPYTDISSALRDVGGRLSLLEPSRLEGLSKRFQTLGAQVEDLLHRRERLLALQPKQVSTEEGTPVDDQVVSDLHAFCEASRPALAVLPSIIERLKLLKQLHQESASTGSRLEGLEARQGELTALMDAAQSQIDDVRASVRQNVVWAKTVLPNDKQAQ